MTENDPDLSKFYREYGESLATRLRAIGHVPGINNRYVFVEDMDSAEELIGASGLKPETNVLVWERLSSEQLRNGGRDNYTSRPQGSLAVIRKPEKDSRAAKQAAFDECRLVALKVIALMLADERDYDSALGKANIRFELDGQAGESIGPLKGGWYGYGFSFDWLTPLDLELTEDDLI